MTVVIEVCLVAFLTLLAYWRGEKREGAALFVFAGLALLFYAFDYWNTNWTMSFLLGIFGIYTFIRAFVGASRE